jgi:HSP20 family molecular chaperone IbpA
MTEKPTPNDPINTFGKMFNDVLGSALGDTANGKPVNVSVDKLFTRAEDLAGGFFRTVDGLVTPQSTARRVQEGQTSYDPFNKNQFGKKTDAAPEASAPKPDATADAKPEPKPEASASEAPFGGLDLPHMIDEVIAFGQGTAAGFGKMLGFGDQPFDVPEFTHVFKGNSAPPTDVVARAESIEYRFAVAGVKPEQVSVELDDTELTVTINTPKNGGISNGETPVVKYLVHEIWSGNWQSTFQIPTHNATGEKREIDEENIKATVQDGLVSILVPFKERVKTKIVVS